MSENNPSHSDDRVSRNTLIIAIILSIAATIAFLEFGGKITHNDAKSDYPISSYQAILISKGEERLISRKQSNQTASCINGYLFITSDANEAMQGLIVDYKNRGIRCQDSKQYESH